MIWRPSWGAFRDGEKFRFRVWAPTASRVDVDLSGPKIGKKILPLEDLENGTFTGCCPEVQQGDRYAYRVDGRGPFPDPASRFQPDGVHGASEVVDPVPFQWSDEGWRGVSLENLVLYELHVGAFTAAGTFRSALAKLPYLAELGVTAVELMPVAEFPGSRNWGYDGVNLYSPSRNYGRPDDLRALVDRAHRLGLGVLLDVVYNHPGPDGSYLPEFSPYYFSDRHETAWGPAFNFDGRHSEMVREFFIENALHWIHEYHMDGFRLDATHAIIDESPRHVLAELASRCRKSAADRRLLFIAEDHRNLSAVLQPEREGGWGLDAVWADDFHHQVRKRLAGDRDGYFQDFSGSPADLAATLRQGWFFCGEYSQYLTEHRGDNPSGLPLRRFVHCLQNHDQIGNRAFGERLHHQIDAAAYRAATALLLMVPSTPLLFMGQEWGASSPFLYFTDHEPSLGEKVTEGRQEEFKSFSAFSHPTQRERIPDPQASETFVSSLLNWEEQGEEGHAHLLNLYRDLIQLRKAASSLFRAEARSTIDPAKLDSRFQAFELDPDTIAFRLADGIGANLLVVVHLPEGRQKNPATEKNHAVRADVLADALHRTEWEVMCTTEDAPYAPDPRPPEVKLTGGAPVFRFSRPSAVILQGRSEAGEPSLDSGR